MKTKRNSRAVHPSSSVLNAPRPHALGHGRRRDIRYGGKRRLLRPGVKSFPYPGVLPKASSKADPEPYNARTSSARASPGRKRNAAAYQGTRPFPYPVPCPPATSAISGSASSGTTAASPKMRLEERLPATRHAVRHRSWLPALVRHAPGGIRLPLRQPPGTPDTTGSRRVCAPAFTVSGIRRHPPAARINANTMTSQPPQRFSSPCRYEPPTPADGTRKGKTYPSTRLAARTMLRLYGAHSRASST